MTPTSLFGERTSWQSVARNQGLFYVITGVWPLLHRRSFEAVTGPKQDWWLVKTVGVLVSTIGASLLLASRTRTQREETLALALGSAMEERK